MPMLAFLLRDINPKKWRQFKALCAMNGRTVREVVLELIYSAASGQIDVKPKDIPKDDK